MRIYDRRPVDVRPFAVDYQCSGNPGSNRKLPGRDKRETDKGKLEFSKRTRRRFDFTRAKAVEWKTSTLSSSVSILTAIARLASA